MPCSTLSPANPARSSKCSESMNRIEINQDAAVDRFIELTAVPGGSGDEADVAAKIVDLLTAAGLDASCCHFDGAEKRTRLSGNCGNLIVTLPGKGTAPRTLLSAHMDTVPICLGAQPVRDGEVIRSGVSTGLGADDRSGCAAILTAAIERLRLGDAQFPPAVIAFFVQEEIGLEGARHLDTTHIGKIDRAFNFDGGTVEKITYGATGGERIEIKVTGIPAHAGIAPEKGASAIVMAARAIADLDARGWLGKIEQGGRQGTSNVGVIHGGEATNVVTPELSLRAEARGHDAEMRTLIVAEIRSAFERAVAAVVNHEGSGGSLTFESHVDYEAFALPQDHPSIVAATETIELTGREPFLQLADGGLDANWLYRHGIEAVTIGCGQREIHTADEYLVVNDFLDACRIATRLITEGGQG